MLPGPEEEAQASHQVGRGVGVGGGSLSPSVVGLNRDTVLGRDGHLVLVILMTFQLKLKARFSHGMFALTGFSGSPEELPQPPVGIS